MANRSRFVGIGDLKTSVKVINCDVLGPLMRKVIKCEVWRKKTGETVSPGICDVWFTDGKQKAVLLKAWTDAGPEVGGRKVFANAVSTAIGEVQDDGLKDQCREVPNCEEFTVVSTCTRIASQKDALRNWTQDLVSFLLQLL